LDKDFQCYEVEWDRMPNVQAVACRSAAIYGTSILEPRNAICLQSTRT